MRGEASRRPLASRPPGEIWLLGVPLAGAAVAAAIWPRGHLRDHRERQEGHVTRGTLGNGPGSGGDKGPDVKLGGRKGKRVWEAWRWCCGSEKEFCI